MKNMLKNLLALGLVLLFATNMQIQAVTITKAVYGTSDGSNCKWNDVSGIIIGKKAFLSYVMNKQVNNDTLGGDPCSGTIKALKVFGNYGGSQTASEGQELSYYPIDIKKAYYGANALDVTDQVKLINNATTKLTNALFPFDPAEGQRKTLYITYSNGSTQSINEGDIITLKK
ncbi:MAG: hypothetical protein P4L31_02375 [Candidatus Babeliales bacterium]|nr:hypothetical protein [Candidatus Babeliales bacterium]